MDYNTSSYTCDQLYDTYCDLRSAVGKIGSPVSRPDPIPRPAEDNPWVRYVLNTLISLLVHEIHQRLVK